MGVFVFVLLTCLSMPAMARDSSTAYEHELHRAVLVGNWDWVFNLLYHRHDKDIKVDERNKEGQTALMIASTSHRQQDFGSIAQLVISYDANVNLRDNDGWTALRHARHGFGRFEHHDVIELLLKNGAAD